MKNKLRTKIKERELKTENYKIMQSRISNNFLKILNWKWKLSEKELDFFIYFSIYYDF